MEDYKKENIKSIVIKKVREIDTDMDKSYTHKHIELAIDLTIKLMESSS